MQKWNLREKQGKEHLDCKKSNLEKSQQSKLVKVNGGWCDRSMDDIVMMMLATDVALT